MSVFEILAVVSIAAGFAFVVALIVGPGTGAPALTSLFISPTMPARPRGVQEMDLPPFVFPDAEAIDTSMVPAQPSADRVEGARAA